MPSYYTVVQYVRDPVRDERVNVGVVAYSGDTVRTHFLRDWSRVDVFFGPGSMTENDLEIIFRGVDPDALHHMISTWKNSIQFTEPGTSLLPVDQTLAIAATRFLVDPAPVQA